MNNKFNMTVGQACAALASGEITSEELVLACIERIREREPEIQAWTALAESQALAQARQLDTEERRSPLHGIPFAAKDIIDSAELLTTYGNRRHHDHIPKKNAAIIRQLESLGAVLLGKTVTTEFACYAPGPTRNPNNLAHTPGGSSSGSAAAVADCHVPFSLGTQTAGSMIRPGSFNGTVAMKPSFGSLSYEGVHTLAPSLDTLGLFTRSIGDLRLLLSSLAPQLRIGNGSDAPKVAVCRTPYWSEADAEMRDAFETYVARMLEAGIDCHDYELNGAFAEANKEQELLMALEGSRALNNEYVHHRDQLDPKTAGLVEQGQRYTPDDECRARNVVARCRYQLKELFRDYDLVVTLAAPGAAPEGLDATGQPTFNRAWTALGVPCLTYPIARNADNLPLGIQFIAPFGDDQPLISMSNHIRNTVEKD